MRHARTLVPWPAVCLLALVAACTGPGRSKVSKLPAVPGESWIVARDPAVARSVGAAGAAALVVRGAGAPAQPSLAKTRVALTLVGPIANVDRTSAWVLPNQAQDLVVAFTPPPTPARQDFLIQVGTRSMTVAVREPAEAKELARTTPQATLVTTDAAGLVAIPLGTLTTREVDLRVQTTGFVRWREGAYELGIPRAPGGRVAFTADVHGPGPLVVMSSPSHAIDVEAVTLEHLRVALRDPGTLCDDDLLLRYRVDPADRPGAVVVEPDGVGQVVGLVLHPFETSHEPVAASDVSIDWNGTSVTEVRPASFGTIAAGTPLVVLARAAGDVRDAITVRVRIGRETRTVTLRRDDAVPRAGIASLWARAGRPTVTAKR